MAKVIKRTWTSRGALGRRVKHVAYGYTFGSGDERERTIRAEWQTESQALDALNARLREVASGQVGMVEPTPDKTLRELVDEYLDHKKTKRSLRDDRRILTKYVLPRFGAERPVRSITGAMIAQYERQRKGQVSDYTLSNELSVIRAALRLAERWGYIDKVPGIEMPKKPEPRERYLEKEEIARLLPACRGSRNPYLAPIVTVAVNTGMRKTEMLSLEWPQVNLSTFTITLHGKAPSGPRRTKSGKPRGIPINADLEAVFQAIEPDPAKRVGLIFKRANGRAWGNIRTAFLTALKRAAIKDCRFHDLRHTFASHYMMRGGSLYDLKEILGHADIKMTMRYAHLSPQHLRAGMERMEGLTGTAVPEKLAHRLAHKSPNESHAETPALANA